MDQFTICDSNLSFLVFIVIMNLVEGCCVFMASFYSTLTVSLDAFIDHGFFSFLGS